jgi:hypothetical protein
MRPSIAPLALAALLLSPAVHAGCIGAVIMGECQGSSVPWDTHQEGYRTNQSPPGFYWDKRSLPQQQRQPGAVDPFTGRDAHDSNWFDDDDDAMGMGGMRGH